MLIYLPQYASRWSSHSHVGMGQNDLRDLTGDWACTVQQVTTCLQGFDHMQCICGQSFGYAAARVRSA